MNRLIDHQDSLLALWRSLWKRLDGNGDGDAFFAQIAVRYGEEHRKYHTLAHIEQCLTVYALLMAYEQSCLLLSRLERYAIELSLWLHDVVYLPGRDDNEACSVEFAKEVIHCAKPSNPLEFQSLVGKLIMASSHTCAPNGGLPERVMIDADLAALGASQDVFECDSRAIREEFRIAVPDDAQFEQGRRAVLRRFLQRKPLYSLPLSRALFERRAQENLRRACGL